MKTPGLDAGNSEVKTANRPSGEIDEDLEYLDSELDGEMELLFPVARSWTTNVLSVVGALAGKGKSSKLLIDSKTRKRPSLEMEMSPTLSPRLASALMQVVVSVRRSRM